MLINAKLRKAIRTKLIKGSVLLKFHASSVKAIGTDRTDAPIISWLKSSRSNLLKILSSMGHGDEILLADAHFPGESLRFCSIGFPPNFPIPEFLEQVFFFVVDFL